MQGRRFGLGRSAPISLLMVQLILAPYTGNFGTRVNASARTDFTVVAVHAAGRRPPNFIRRIDKRFLAVRRHGNMDMLPSAGRLPLPHSFRMAIQ